MDDSIDAEIEQRKKKSREEGGPAIIQTTTFDSNIHQLHKKKNLFKLKSNSYSPTFEHAPIDLMQEFNSELQAFDPGKPVFRPPANYESPSKRATQFLLSTFISCNSLYDYQPINNPKRFITKLTEGALNDNYDNSDCDYILSVNDIIGSKEGHQ
jgi:hypothetical protein